MSKSLEALVAEITDVEEVAHEFAHFHGRHEIPTKPGHKFSKPDSTRYWGLNEGFKAGAASQAALSEALLEAIESMRKAKQSTAFEDHLEDGLEKIRSILEGEAK